MTYKDRLSRVGTSKNAEWAPIEKVVVPGPTPGSAHISKSVECERGIRYMIHPPDLRKEPQREDWNDEAKSGEYAHACRKTVQLGHELDLTPEARKEWTILAGVHSKYTHSGECSG